MHQSRNRPQKMLSPTPDDRHIEDMQRANIASSVFSLLPPLLTNILVKFRRHVRLLCLLGTSCEVSPSAATGETSECAGAFWENDGERETQT